MAEPIKAIITDIEGTVAPISFVATVLFPFSRERLPAYLREHANDPRVVEALAQIARQIGVENLSHDLAISTLNQWIDEDRKETALKTLQGLVWADGYAEGVLRSMLYPDVAPRLRAWHAGGLKLFVYSSGSVAAQKLLFGYTQDGDLTGLFDGYFDTKIGGKKDAPSYQAILAEIGFPAASVLFLSDSEAELDAAASIGIATARLVRPDDADATTIASHHAIHTDLTTIQPTGAN